MRFFEFATVVTAIGCGTGVIITTVDKVLGGRRGGREDASRLSQERSQERLEQQERELAALRRQNEQLQRQLEWHNRLLERGQQEPLPSGR